jgi:hypothetical protein
LTEQDGELIEAKLPLLREQAFYSGHLTDADIYDILGEDLISSEIKNMSSRPLIQQRAILLNSPAAAAIRRKRLEERRTKEAETNAKRAAATDQKKLELVVKTAVQKNKVHLHAGPPPDAQPTFCYGNCRKLRGQGGGANDGWKACPCCRKTWSCMQTANCRKELTSHISYCMAACHIAGVFELPADIVINAAAAAEA